MDVQHLIPYTLGLLTLPLIRGLIAGAFWLWRAVGPPRFRWMTLRNMPPIEGSLREEREKQKRLAKEVMDSWEAERQRTNGASSSATPRSPGPAGGRSR